MSRGLGKMQRAILDAADEWRATLEKGDALGERRTIMGHDLGPYHYWRGGRSNDYGTTCVQHRREFKPPADVIDLWAISRLLAGRHNALDYDHIKRPFQAAFSRAVRTLVERGYLEMTAGNQRRFCRKRDVPDPTKTFDPLAHKRKYLKARASDPSVWMPEYE